MRSVLIVDRFHSGSRELRAHFDARFGQGTGADRASEGRFVWDYWEVPDQYRLLRTPAYHFFPKKAYEAFHRKLVLWGREHLGCHDISPPWLSCYVEGCGQELHGDLPHGPWAFVYSLTPWERRRFRGGETMMLRDEILSYWEGFKSGRGLEHEGIFRKIPPRFDRLTVFDPRVPHGVKRLEGGVHDVRQGRLVIHGWFVQPRPFIEGSLAPRSVQSAIDGVSEELGRLLDSGAEANGVLSLRFGVSRSGAVTGLKLLSNTLRSGRAEDARALVSVVLRHLRSTRFGKQRGTSRVTLPLIFETR
jgi:hypothetical protein